MEERIEHCEGKAEVSDGWLSSEKVIFCGIEEVTFPVGMTRWEVKLRPWWHGGGRSVNG